MSSAFFKLALRVMAVLAFATAARAVSANSLSSSSSAAAPQKENDNSIIDVCRFVKAELFREPPELDCTNTLLVCTKLANVFECDKLGTSVVGLDLSRRNLTRVPPEVSLLRSLTRL